MTRCTKSDREVSHGSLDWGGSCDGGVLESAISFQQTSESSAVEMGNGGAGRERLSWVCHGAMEDSEEHENEGVKASHLESLACEMGKLLRARTFVVEKSETCRQQEQRETR